MLFIGILELRGLGAERWMNGMPSSTENSMADGLAGMESLLAGLDQQAGPLDARAKQQAAVLAFGRRTSAQPPLNVLIEDAAAMIAEVLQVDRIGVGEVIVPTGSGLSFRLATLAKQGLLRDMIHHEYTMDPACSMGVYTLQVGSPIVSPNVLMEDRFTDLFLRNVQVSGALMLPLVVNGQPFGVVGVFDRQERSFSAEDIQFAETITYLLISSLGRIQAEEQLHHQQSFSQNVLEMIDALVVSLDLEGRIQNINPTLQKVSGFQLEEIRDRPFWDVFVAPEEVNLIQSIFRTACNERAPSELECTLLDKYSQKRRVSWTLKRLEQDKGSSVILCGIDLTEKLLLQEELRKVSTRVQETTKVLIELCTALQTSPPAVSPQMISTIQKVLQPQEPDSHPFQPLMRPILDEHRQFVRRMYRYPQKIAPYLQGRFPHSEDFWEVQCKDISAGGIAFYMDKKPPYRRLVVALGQGSATSYFLAETVRISQVDHEGQKAYLIGCKFCGRITPPTDFEETPSSK